jgi:hypothetical protein
VRKKAAELSLQQYRPMGDIDPIHDTQAVLPACQKPPPVHFTDSARIAQLIAETE